MSDWPGTDPYDYPRGDGSDVPVFPMQADRKQHGTRSTVPQVVALKAYEVYKHVYGEQQALITGGCRGGFHATELIAFLYAHSFPKEEWAVRVEEGMRGLRM